MQKGKDDPSHKLRTIKEGLVKITVPEFEKISSEAPVFYNPQMEFNRDISILALQNFQEELEKDIKICDLFGGSGIRGIRYKKEISGVNQVTINDISSMAIENIVFNGKNNNLSVKTIISENEEDIENNTQSKDKRELNDNTELNNNTELNEKLDLKVKQKEANILLRQGRGEFDIVDVDPFGTPSYFIDSLGYSLKKNSLACVTATDTSALCGTYKEPALRKYNASAYKSEYCHETGIRILIGFVALSFGKYKKYLIPQLSHSSQHYMRTYLKVKKGSADTDESLKTNIGYIGHCPKCLYRKTFKGIATAIDKTCPECGDDLIIAGPLWIGNIHNKDFIKGMIEKIPEKSLNTEKKILKLLNSCYEESDAPITFYDVHKISKVLKISAPKLDELMDKLKEEGYSVVRTHFNPLGIKTNADIKIIKKMVQELSSDNKKE